MSAQNDVHPTILACMWFAPPRRVQALAELLEPVESPEWLKADLRANQNKTQQHDRHALDMQIREQVQ